MKVRGLVAGVLVLVGCLAALPAVPALWAERQVRSEAYVETVGPLIRDPALQADVAERVTAEITRQLDPAEVTDVSLGALSELGVPASVLRQVRRALDPAQAAVAALVEKEVRAALAGPAAERVWTSALRDTRAAVVRGAADQVDPVTVDFAPVVEDVKRRLVADGLGVAAEIRPRSTTVEVVSVSMIGTARGWYDTLGTLVVVLPVTVAAAFVLALLIAPRRRTLLGIAFGTAAAMAVLVLGLTLARGPALDALGPGERTVGTAAYDALAGSLRTDAWWVFGIAAGLGLVVLLISAARPRRPA